LRPPHGARDARDTMAIRVALAEDSFLVREALRQLLRAEADLDLVAVCADGDELRAALAEHDVDVVVTDIRMPPSMDDEGLRIAAELHRSAPHVGVVVLSAYCDAALATELLTTGSDRRGYLLKERVHSRRQLTATIKAVAGGSSAIDPKVVQSLVEARRRRVRSPLSALSRPERDVLGSMAAGASNAAIAGELGLTKRSVEKHINGIFAKLELDADPDVSRRVSAVVTFLAEAGGRDREGERPRPTGPARRRAPRGPRRPLRGTSTSP
jgi:DNA-binding NarL/FixJ family response regulator